MIGTSDGQTYEDRFDYLANEPMGGSMPKQQTAPNTIDSFTPAQPKIEFNRDIEPDGPMPIPESKDAMNEPQGFADRNWKRNREVGGTLEEGPGQIAPFENQPAPYGKQWDLLDNLSANIEDRRNDPDWPNMVKQLIGFYPKDISDAIRDIREGTPIPRKEQPVILRAEKGSLEQQAGRNDMTEMDRIMNKDEEFKAQIEEDNKRYEKQRKDMDDLITRTEKRIEDMLKEVERKQPEKKRK